MMAGHKNALDCIKRFSETDFTEDLKRIDVPTLIMHGDDDQIVPIDARVARHVHDQQGSDQRRSAGVHQGMSDWRIGDRGIRMSE
jgi:non-heme chloroperoxidase